MKFHVKLIALFIVLTGMVYSCKNKRTRTCYLVAISEQDTVGKYKQAGLFNRRAEQECEAEVDNRDTLDEYFGSVHWCECDIKRE